MRIFIDYQIFSLQKYGGISRYFYELMNNFRNNKDLEIQFPIYFSNNTYLINSDFLNIKSFFPDLILGIKNNYTRYLNSKNLIISKEFAESQNYDIMHPTFYNSYFLEHAKKKPFVFTVHDLTYEKFPNLLNLQDKEIRENIYKKASKIIAVSQNTKEDLIKFYNLDSNKISVVYHGNSLEISKLNQAKSKRLNLPNRYLLFVGNRKKYKNFQNFIMAVSSLIIDDKSLNVVCVGDKFSKSEKQLFTKHNILKNILQIKVNDEMLTQIYSNAIAFVYPSMYEGFGIPILEAFACNCPVVVSHTSSLPEVAENAALYFDPKNVEDIQKKIADILKDDLLRKNLIKLGQDRLKKFSWQKCAEETKKVYESVL